MSQSPLLNSKFLPPALDGAAIIASTFLASKTSLVTWLKSPISPEGLGACALVNTCTVAAANYFGKTDDKDATEGYKAFINAAGFAAGFALTAALAKPLAKRSGMILNTASIATVAAFHFVVKASAYATYHLTLNLHKPFTLGNFTAKKDFEDMTPEKTGQCKGRFETAPASWDALPLNLQVAFNMQLEKIGQKALAYTNLTTGDEALTKEEVAVFAKSLGETVTAEQAKVLYDHSSAPADREYGKDELHKVELKSLKIEDLTIDQVKWCHKICTADTPDLSTEEFKAFANAFYAADLPQPSNKFETDKALPESASLVSKNQASYFTSYYKGSEKLDTLTQSEKTVLHALFVKQGIPHTDPAVEEMSVLSKGALEVYKEHYETTTDQWDSKAAPFQTAFNSALEDAGLTVIPLTERPMATWKKVAIVGSIALLVVGGGVAFSLLEAAAVQSGDSTTPTPTPTPVLEAIFYCDNGDSSFVSDPFSLMCPAPLEIKPLVENSDINPQVFEGRQVEDLTFGSAVMPHPDFPDFADSPTEKLFDARSLKNLKWSTSIISQEDNAAALEQARNRAENRKQADTPSTTLYGTLDGITHEDKPFDNTTMFKRDFEVTDVQSKPLVKHSDINLSPSWMERITSYFLGNRTRYNEHADAQWNSLGKPTFDAFHQNKTCISKEIAKKLSNDRAATKAMEQAEMGLPSRMVIQIRQGYDYHFKHEANKGNYRKAYQLVSDAFWRGDANPTYIDFERLGKTPEQIACSAYKTDGSNLGQLGTGPRSCENQITPIEQQKHKTTLTTHFAYFGLIEAAALFALTRVGKCFARCCRRKERPHQGFAVEEKVTLLSAGNITSQWVTDTAEKGDYIKKSLDYATITALGKVTTYIRARFMSPGGEDLEPTLESVNFQVSDFKVSKMFDSGVETVTARFFSDRTIKALQPESVTRTFVEP